MVGPYIKFGLAIFVAFIAGGLAFFLFRRKQINGQLKKADERRAPDSESPAYVEPKPAPRPYVLPDKKRRPARRFAWCRKRSPARRRLRRRSRLPTRP